MNPFLELNPNENFSSKSTYLSKDDIFLSINGGAKYLNKNDIQKAKYIYIDEEDQLESNSKFKVIKGLNKNYLSWIDEYYQIAHSNFNNIFITGTNGKTSAVNFLSQVFKFNSLSFASTGTLGTFLNQKNYFHNELTTENPLFIRRLMSKCTKESIENIFFEASSIGIDQGRLEGLNIDHAIITNISRDHIDYHKSMDNYIDAKIKLISGNDLETIALNIDDEIISRRIKELTSEVIFTVSDKNKNADIFFTLLNQYNDGSIEFKTETPWGKFVAQGKLISKFNIYNLLLTLPYFQSIHKDCDKFFDAVQTLCLPKGRLDQVSKNIYVDYAHTPVALEEVCNNLQKKGAGLAIVFGAGGDRDEGKRKLMGQVADRYCNKIYITNDNPRSEDPNQISVMIQEGISKKNKTHIELNRALAIKKAIDELKDDEILLIAGKGHENSQIVGNRIIEYSDYEEIKKCIV